MYTILDPQSEGSIIAAMKKIWDLADETEDEAFKAGLLAARRIMIEQVYRYDEVDNALGDV